MKCDRTKPEKFWTNFGKNAAAIGYTVEWATDPISTAYPKVKEWIAAGHAEQTRKMARQGSKR